MWKPYKDDQKETPHAPVPPATAAGTPKEVRSVEMPKTVDHRAEIAHIGKSVLIKGELSGSEDLYLDGEVEGTIELHNNSLTIGPNGRVRAHVHGRDVIIHGKVDGNVKATERVELKRTAVLVGDISTQRIVIEDGAFFKGAIDIQREQKQESKKDASFSNAAVAGSGTPAAVGTQSSLLDAKK